MDRRGRIVGMVFFVLGIAIVLFVFFIAFRMFNSPASELIPTTKGAPPVSFAGLGNAAVLLIVRIVLLFLMTLAGSVIAGKGIQLYLGSCEAPAKPE